MYHISFCVTIELSKRIVLTETNFYNTETPFPCFLYHIYVCRRYRDCKQLVLQGYSSSFTQKIGHLHVVFSDGRDNLNGWGGNFFCIFFIGFLADS